MAPVENRAYPRVSFNVDVDYKIVSAPERASSPTTRSKNISENGIRIVTLEKINPDTVLDLKFLLPGSKEAVLATARVVWAKEFMVGNLNSSKACDTGLEFVSISKEDKGKINQFVRSGS